MSIGDRIKRFLVSPSERFAFLASLGVYNHMSDEKYLKKKFKLMTGNELDIENPQGFRQKLQWLKLYNRRPEYTHMVDKYQVKQFVANLIGEEYVIPLIGVWDRFEDIDFSKLPNQFVLKCTHDSGGLVICKDKSCFDIEKARGKICASLKRNYFYVGREWPYKDVQPRIICEQYMQNIDDGQLKDYKLYCFNGKVKFIMVNTDRNSPDGMKGDYFDEKFNHLDLVWGYEQANPTPVKPENFDEMIRIAEKLSNGIPHVRVDMYNCNGRILFGELTFFCGSGFDSDNENEWDRILGDWLVLPEKFPSTHIAD